MKVKELIEILQNVDEDLDVLIFQEECSGISFATGVDLDHWEHGIVLTDDYEDEYRNILREDQ